MMSLRMRMSLLWNLVFLASFCFTFLNLSEAHSDQKKLPSAVVVGTVYCETCFHQDFSKSSHFISGATVAVECREDTNTKPSFRELVKTNEHGEFKVNLPFSVSKHIKRIKACSVKLISSSEPFCAVASTATSSLLRLKSRKEGTHIFSAGFFTFKPLKQPELCDQKPSIKNSKKKINGAESSISNSNDPTFFPPIRDPPSSDLPPLGQTYLPPLPSLPNLPSLPIPGVPTIPPQTTSRESRQTSEVSDNKAVERRPNGFFPFPPNPFRPPSIFPPNPLLPPPSILPPNPLQPPPSIFPPIFPSPPPSIFPPIFPSPPPSIFPPIFPSPPPSIFPPIFPKPPSPPSSIFPPLIPSPGSSPPFNIPPLIPGLTPSPPPPPQAPTFPFPFPFPFQPVPGFPGVPPAVPSSSSKKNHP